MRTAESPKRLKMSWLRLPQLVGEQHNRQAWVALHLAKGFVHVDAPRKLLGGELDSTTSRHVHHQQAIWEVSSMSLYSCVHLPKACECAVCSYRVPLSASRVRLAEDPHPCGLARGRGGKANVRCDGQPETVPLPAVGDDLHAGKLQPCWRLAPEA